MKLFSKPSNSQPSTVSTDKRRYIIMIKNFNEIVEYMKKDPEWDKPDEAKESLANSIANILLGA